jgi:hypothetical protein
MDLRVALVQLHLDLDLLLLVAAVVLVVLVKMDPARLLQHLQLDLEMVESVYNFLQHLEIQYKI